MRMMMKQAVPVLLLLCALTVSPASAQAPAPSTAEKPVGAAVKFGKEELFSVYASFGPFTSQDRARVIAQRLERLANDPDTDVERITTVDREQSTDIVLDETILVAVTDTDAQPLGKTRQALAKEYALKIRHALSKQREQTSVKSLLIDSLLAVLDTLVLVGLLVLFRKGFPKVYAKIDAWRGTYIRAIKVQRVEVVSARQITDLLIGLAKAIRVIATLLLLYFYISSVLGIFPWTKGVSAQLFGAVFSTLRAIGQAFVTYVPDVVSIIVIVVVTRYIIKLIHLIFNGIERGAITFAGFHRDWASPTYKIVRFLVIVFGAIAAFPYIPGSRSEAFRAISIFLGVLFSLGSTGAISNIISGLVLTYMRPFQIGDRVKIADTIGDVTARELLVTRVRTIKNVDITIPNVMVLSSHIINFSSSAKDRGLILHTSVTIGYDAPWRTVHKLLIDAAKATTHILEKPEPFVLQTSLDDFYVTYEINAYTNEPSKMATIYAELHQNIQDKFNEAGVEIMSPHYSQIRDGNKTTIPEEYLPKTYEAPAFRIAPLETFMGKREESSLQRNPT
ncbi:MAG: mechanosensitive ion channel protein [Nitrospiraceae bacterium]|nr:MAG: mechanosensitive ion channel protein [Nitrospiraceae bacterium]